MPIIIVLLILSVVSFKIIAGDDGLIAKSEIANTETEKTNSNRNNKLKNNKHSNMYNPH